MRRLPQSPRKMTAGLKFHGRNPQQGTEQGECEDDPCGDELSLLDADRERGRKQEANRQETDRHDRAGAGQQAIKTIDQVRGIAGT